MKILPIHDDPFITNYNVYGAIFSIIGSDNFFPWLYTNFIGVAVNNYDDTLYFTDHFSLLEYGNQSSCPGIRIEKPTNKEIVHMYHEESIVDVVIKAIDNDKYVWLYLDRYYIPESDDYQKKHNDHSLLVYGYDEQNQFFYIADNLVNGKFMTSKCSFELFEKAWISEVCHHYRRFFLYIIKQDGTYILDKNILVQGIIDYLDSNKITQGVFWDQKPVDGPHSYVQDQSYWIFGQEIYSYLNDLIYENHYIDIRLFHLLWEHKKCMQGRISFFESDNDKELSEKYRWVENHSKVMRNMVIKYNLTRDKSILKTISEGMKAVAMEERMILRDFLNKVDN
ncbi:BtrH N-terminal domain-containing protein [Paenibacillus humicus]|uniref:BtrH N-terminal domain-containing protein n=1 Tax=Paenibacillus humicus TaxID=412861 RepID=UPI003D2C3640